MASSDFDMDSLPVPRSREENQERAFVAASRRKDRSLDARLESAHRASVLHKKRTGKSLRITKEIVEREAMYEEVDECFQEKRIRMLQAQNLQIEEQFQRHLLATLSAEVQGTQQRSSMNRQMSMGNEGKLSLDLTGLRSPFSDGMHTGPMTSPAFTNNGYVLSPGAYSNQSTQSYIPGMNAPVSPMPNIPSQFPSYIQQAPTWESIGAQQPVGGLWTGVNQRSPGPNMQPSMWQPQTMPLPPSRPRERLGSAPEIPIQPRTSGSAAHSRVNSEPNLPNANTNASDHFGDSGPNSPKQSETQSTSELCPTPTTPLSPPLAHQAQEQQHVSIKEEPDGMFAPTDKLDSAFDEFNHWSPMGLSDESGFRELDGFGMDDLIVWDEFTGMPTLS